VIDAEGWRYACLALAALVLAIVPLNLVLQRRRPQDLGLLPDGAASPGAATAAAAPAPAVTEWTLRGAARTARFWWFAGACFCSMFAWYAVQVHQTRYLIDTGFGRTEAAFALALVALFGIGGQIGTGYLSDRVGRPWAWTLANAGFVLCFLLLLRLQGQPDPVLMYAMVAAQGLLAYGISPLYSAVPADLFPGRSFGAIYGTLSLATSLGAAAGPWGTGSLHDLTGSYVAAFWLCLALALLPIAFIWQVAARSDRAVAVAR
jgi:MFS family permease